MSVTFKEEENVGFIEFNQLDSKVNVLNFETVKRLDSLLDEIKTKTSLKAVIFQSFKPGCFIAGADIKEIEKIIEPEDGHLKAKAGQDVFNKIEDLPVPTIAVIDGVALGGGCELSLACLYRVATFNDKVKIGLPEVNLGFVPGFGGTYRLPRIVGLSEGIKMVLAGKPIDGSKAHRIGLVDILVPQTGLKNHVHTFVDDIIHQKITKQKYKRKKKKGMKGFLDNNVLGHKLVFKESYKSVMKLSKGFYPAPLKAIEVIKKNFYMNRDRGMLIESKAFGELAVTDVSKALVQVFYLMEKYKKLSVDGAESVKPQPIEKCAVLGAGVMGGGIAQLTSYKDIWTRLKDLNYDALALGYKSASKVYQGLVKKRRISKSIMAAKMAKITGTLDYSGFKNLDMVIEAVVENMDIKKSVFKELSDVVSDKTILATNTSALSVTEMASVTKDPSKVIGIHFFNPVHRMPLIEVITTDSTSKETIVSTLKLVQRLGKTPILVKDAPGFIVNRILLAYMSEAGRILDECGEMERVDKLMTDFGMPMGPFLLSDEVGLDVGLKVMHILEDAFGERFKAVDFFEKILEAGLLGKKVGKGFYVHGKKRQVNPEASKYITNTDASKFNEQDYLDRMVYIMINEAAMCLEEKVVDEASAIDVGMIFGTGFPPFRGGLLRYADSLGVDHIVSRLESFNDSRFKPAKYLLKLKENKKGFF